MYKNVLVLIVTMIMIMGISLNVYAAETVTFTSDNKLIYPNINGKYYLGDDLKGMTPGEVKEQIITIKNDNEQTAKFYVSAIATQSSEENNQSEPDGIFLLTLKVDKDNRILCQNEQVKVNRIGNEFFFQLSEDLIKNTYIATLQKGESAKLYISISPDGKTIDNNYKRASGSIEFNFSVSYDTPTKIVEVEGNSNNIESTNVNILKTKAANTVAALKTGDTTPILMISTILVIGIILLFITRKKNLEKIS